MRTWSDPISPQGSACSALGRQRGLERVACVGEDRVDAIVDRFEDNATGRLDCLAQDGTVTRSSQTSHFSNACESRSCCTHLHRIPGN